MDGRNSDFLLGIFFIMAPMINSNFGGESLRWI